MGKSLRLWFLTVALGYATLQAWELSLSSLQLLAQGPEAFFPPFGPKYTGLWGWVVAHGVSACLLLSLGPVLLLRPVLPLPKGWHPLLGKTYLALSGLALLSGIPLSLQAEGGWPASLSFLSLSGVWAWASFGIFGTARRRQFRRHQQWVRFHYSLAFSAVFLRIGLGLAAYFDYEVGEVAALMGWLSWQPAMIYAWRVGLLSHPGLGWKGSYDKSGAITLHD